MPGRPDDLPLIPAGLILIEGSEGKLKASAWYHYIPQRGSVVLHGEKLPDGDFRPIIKYQTTGGPENSWKDIRGESTPQAEACNVSAENRMLSIVIDLEPFQPYITTQRFGRVVFENGEVITLSLEDLLPTADGGDKRNFKVDVKQSLDQKIKEGFVKGWEDDSADLFSVVSVQSELAGDLIYDNRSNRTAALKGRYGPDGYFWAQAKLQYYGPDDAWRDVANSETEAVSTTFRIPPNKAEKIRVSLNGFKPLLKGKAKFGRIILSDGKPATFLLNLIRPIFDQSPAGQ